MTEEKIIDAIGNIDDSLIEETEKIRKRKKSLPFSKIALVAACLMLVFVIVYFVPLILGDEGYIANEESGENVQTEATTDSMNLEEENAPDSSDTTDNEQTTESSANGVEGESLTDNFVKYLPIYVSVTDITSDGLTCTVVDNMDNKDYIPGDILAVHIFDYTLLPDESLSVGDLVYVTYSINRCDHGNSVTALEIFTKEEETIP